MSQQKHPSKQHQKVKPDFPTDKTDGEAEVCGKCMFAEAVRRHNINGLVCCWGMLGHPYEDLQEVKNSRLLSFEDTCEHWTPKEN